MILLATPDNAAVYPSHSQQTSLASLNPYEGLSRSGRVDVATFSDREKINSLRSWTRNWDGAGSAAPNWDAVAHAVSKLMEFSQMAEQSGFAWRSPQVSASEDGEVVFEWWNGSHKLTIYVGPQTAEFVRVWGPSIVDQMADGSIDQGTFLGLWRWLNA